VPLGVILLCVDTALAPAPASAGEAVSVPQGHLIAKAAPH
jgi:hypothetical protein